MSDPYRELMDALDDIQLAAIGHPDYDDLSIPIEEFIHGRSLDAIQAARQLAAAQQRETA